MKGWRKQILFYSIIGMMSSLFCSRALLTFFMAVFVLVSFFHVGIKKQIRNYFSSPLLWGISLLFFLPLLSGLYSGDKNEWLDIIRIKLPLLFLPLAFAGPFTFSKKEWEWLAIIFITLITAASIWSMVHYTTNISVINEGYLRAKSIITPLENDHVRFSWLISVTILMAGWHWIKRKKQDKIISWLLPVTAVWLIVFLHILAARTGILSFYITVLIAVLWRIVKRVKILQTITLATALIVLPVGAYFLLPTFHNRVQYFIYDLGYFSEAHYLQGSNDGVRIISIKAGWNIMNTHPANGVGFGDVFTETKKWYAANYPQMAETDKIYPGSEWMMYGAACGWPGFLLLTGIMMIPFFVSLQNKLCWWMLNSTAAFSFLFDIGLEVQFGVFAYTFIVLWWWAWLKDEKM